MYVKYDKEFDRLFDGVAHEKEIISEPTVLVDQVRTNRFGVRISVIIIDNDDSADDYYHTITISKDAAVQNAKSIGVFVQASVSRTPIKLQLTRTDEMRDFNIFDEYLTN